MWVKKWINLISSSKSYTMWKNCTQCDKIVTMCFKSCLKHTRIVFLMVSNICNGISEYLRPLKLLVTKVSAEVGFCRLFSHCSTYSVSTEELINFFYYIRHLRDILILTFLFAVQNKNTKVDFCIQNNLRPVPLNTISMI
jgi:hypothetical protein